MREWVKRNTGLVCIAVGWVFAFAGIAIAPYFCISEELDAPIGFLIIAIFLFGFGIGWIVRDERSER